MPVEIKPEMIKEIAGELDCGMKCFYHIHTGEMVSYPDELRMGGDIDEELWQEIIDKVEENFDEYIPFEGMDSRESFRLMQDYIDDMTDPNLQQKFLEIIQRKKPFQQFKYLLLDYPDLREKWFAYKGQRMIEYVEEQLQSYNRRNDDNDDGE